MFIDILVYNAMLSIENPILTAMAKIISAIFDPISLIILSLIILTYLFLKHKKKQSIFFTTTILITAATIEILKNIFQIVRPQNSIIIETGFSFPSGHATMSVMFLGLVTYMFAKKNLTITKIITTLIILIVGFSRIYLRVHWLTDVLAGFILGSIILIITIQIYNKIFTFSKSNKPRNPSRPRCRS